MRNDQARPLGVPYLESHAGITSSCNLPNPSLVLRLQCLTVIHIGGRSILHLLTDSVILLVNFIVPNVEGEKIGSAYM